MIQPSSYGWFMTWPSSIGPVPCPNFPISSPAISWPSGCDKDFWSISFTAARPDGTMGIHGDPMIREKPRLEVGGVHRWHWGEPTDQWRCILLSNIPQTFKEGNVNLLITKAQIGVETTKELGQWVTRNDQLCGFDLGLPEIFWFIITFPIKSPSLEYHYNIPDFQRPVC